MVNHLPILREGHIDYDLVHHRDRIFCLHIHEYLSKACLRIGVHRHPVDVGKAHRLLHYKVDASPQTGAHQPRHYVPAITVARLPDPDRLRIMPETGYPYHILLSLLHGRTDYNLHQVVSRPGLAGYIETMRNHSVVRMAEMLSVQPDIGYAVYPFEVQHQLLPVLQRRSIEMAAVHPLVTLPLA